MTNDQSHSEVIEPHTQAGAPDGKEKRFPFVAVFLLLAAAGGLGVVIYSGINNRLAAQSVLRAETQKAAIPAVAVVHPTLGSPSQEITLPGSIQAYTDTPIFARTNGYLKAWHAELGAHVKQGQLLAEIEAPEVDKQLDQARADLQIAQANLDLAKSTAERWQSLLKLNSVSSQETAEKVSDLSVKKATFDSMAANVARLQDIKAYQKIYAPFDGVVIARNTDIGALIDAGANSPGRELFHLAAIQKLRVFVNVPQVFSRASRPGGMATLTFDELPGQKFHGRLVRTANAIDPSSRTLLTEIEVDNPDGKLLPGAYVTVHLPLPEQVHSVMLPSNTLLFRAEGPRAGVVHDGRVELVPIAIGRDFGLQVEIVSGIKTTDLVISDPPDSLVDGQQVRILETAEATKK